jgi:putative DNA primase/helicase
MNAAEILSDNGITLESTAPGKHATTCPQCSAKRKPGHRKLKVLGVKIDDRGVCWRCNHCGWSGPEKAKGGNSHAGGFAATHDYRDANGALQFQKVRYPPGHNPRFRIRHRDESGGWIWGAGKKANTKILYRIDEVRSAIEAGQCVAVVEGEKDVDALWAIGIAATCNAHGAHDPTKKQKPKWRTEHSEQLRDADIIVFNDNDVAGYEHADAAARLLLGIAKRVRRLDLAPHWPDIPKDGDVSDWLALGHTRKELDALIDQAPVVEAKSEAEHAPEQTLPPPSAPMAVARRFVEACCIHNGKDDELTLRYWYGGWWTWRTTHWVEAEQRTVRAMLYAFTEHAVYLDGLQLKQWLPTRYKIGDLMEALSAIVILPDDFEQPGWLDGRGSGPIVATNNGLLDIASRQLHPHTPLYFGQLSVPFPYDPDAPEPKRWHAFLDELWPDEPDAIDLLGEWFGYVISGRLDLHKILVMVGPTRGGKGVIARILTALIGKRNVCGPTLSSLGGEFGLAPLLGKSLAIISDARFGGGKNAGVVVERLLSISGEDTLTVNRKYREQRSGKLPVRFHVISNELPRLGDASSAIIGRVVLLLTTRSWLGRENHELEAELRAELPGILNFALEGLQRLTLTNENRFTSFAGAEDAIVTMQDLASPVGAFVRELCTVKSTLEVEVEKLYAAYKDWCEASEYPKSSKHVFGRDLRAACPSIKKVRPEKDGKKLPAIYKGIGLGQT